MVYIKQCCLPELLAPAGSFEHLVAAIKAGADAVYLGAKQFGARAYAGNFSKEELVRAIYYAHFYEKKVYLTVNTLMKEKELKEQFFSFLLPFYKAGLDGVIVQDMGTASFIREYFPGLDIHGSTQMTITSKEGAIAAKRMGMNRIVLARELSLSEIRSIKEKTGLEIEIFIHGALCYCYSGQCFLSSVYGGRSGNRGKCAQPCRLPYQLYDCEGKRRNFRGNYLLSPKDLCSLELLPEIIKTGVDSLKIEGRMKNPEYVAGVTAIYRKYLDYYKTLSHKGNYSVQESDKEILEELFSRSGFSSGYFKQHNGKNMMSVRHPNHLGREIGTIESIHKNKITFTAKAALHARDILIIPLGSKPGEEVILTVPNCLDSACPGSKVTMNAAGKRQLKPGMKIYRRKNTKFSEWIQEEILQKDLKKTAYAVMKAGIGRRTTLVLRSGTQEVIMEAEPAQKALGKAISREDVLKQLKKTGTVPFYLNEAEIQIEDNLFLPLSVIKKLRQEGYALLEDKIKKEKCRTINNKEVYDSVILTNNNLPFKENYDMIGPKLILTVYSLSMLEYCLKHFDVDGYCLSLDFWNVNEVDEAKGCSGRYHKPLYLSLPRIVREKDLSELSWIFTDCDGYYVHNINEAEYLAQGYIKNDILKDDQKIKTVIFGNSFYQWNSFAVKEIRSLYEGYFDHLIYEYPMELSFKESKAAVNSLSSKDNCELLLYGHFPVMVSAQCLNQTTKGCTRTPGLFWLNDRNNRRLPVTTHCKSCYNLIWSDQPRNWLDKDFITKVECPGRVRIDLFHASNKQIDEIMNQFTLWKQKIFN